MARSIIDALRRCAQTRWLSESELHDLAECGRPCVYAAGETVLDPTDVCLCILLRGRVRLSIHMKRAGGQCGGETTLELMTPGVAFGWGKWVDSARIAISACAVTSVTVVRFEMADRLCTSSFTALGLQMVLHLYGLLQEGGLCPPNVGAFLEMSKPIKYEGDKEE